MVDPAALREALARFETAIRAALNSPEVSKEWQQSINDYHLMHDAAREFLRLMETAETVWWCEEHHHTAGLILQPERGCWARYVNGQECRMVVAVLTRREDAK